MRWSTVSSSEGLKRKTVCANSATMSGLDRGSVPPSWDGVNSEYRAGNINNGI